MVRSFFFTVSTLLLLFACTTQPDPKTQIAQLDAQTMTIHDAAMKEMSEMNRLGRQMKQKLSAIDTTQAAARALRTTYIDALTNMKKAEDDMMDWMTQYKSPDDKPAAEAIRYLQQQNEKIAKNQADIHAALEQAKKIMDND